MITAQIHPYWLKPRVALNAKTKNQDRAGALLKIQWPDHKIGYADLFPWPELGDPPLPYHLQELAKGRETPLTQAALALAFRDARLRAEKKSAFEAFPSVKNHFTIADYETVPIERLTEVKSQGFTTLKIKVGRNWAREVEWLTAAVQKGSFSLRLDFNAQLDYGGFCEAMPMLPSSVKEKIEFIEDPFPFDEALWRKASELVPLALDNEYDKIDWKQLGPAPFQVLVLKPARQDVPLALSRVAAFKLKVVVTSAMDHPLGVMHALSVAAELKAQAQIPILDCGLLTTALYDANEFSKQVMTKGPILIPAGGTGIGFDSILEGLPWQPLI